MTRKKLNKTLVSGVVFTAITIASQSAVIAQNQQEERFRITLDKDPSYCMDVRNVRIANGTPIQISKCKEKNHPAQTWIKGDCDSGDHNEAIYACNFQYQLAANPKYCLDYTYSKEPPKRDDSTILQLWQCKDAKDGDSAYWYWSSENNGDPQKYSNYSAIYPIHRGSFNIRATVPKNDLREGTIVRLMENEDNWRFWNKQFLYQF
ncbi:MAG: hypothetical protein AAF757_00075 [Cyanobacteria bacterium P01_D01_bin.116]